MSKLQRKSSFEFSIQEYDSWIWLFITFTRLHPPEKYPELIFPSMKPEKTVSFTFFFNQWCFLQGRSKLDNWGGGWYSYNRVHTP